MPIIKFETLFNTHLNSNKCLYNIFKASKFKFIQLNRTAKSKYSSVLHTRKSNKL